MNSNLVTLVLGYHPVTAIPKCAVESKLVHRFAVVIHTETPEHERLLCRDGFFLSLLANVSRLMEYDELRVLAEPGKVFSSIEAYASSVMMIPEEERDPPWSVHLLLQQKIVFVEETEFWVSCGGPNPYSDSYTFSFYSSMNMDDKLEAATRETCSNMGVVVGERLIGSATPIPPSLWQLWWNWLKR